jgi:hypothetical protein
MILLSFLSPRKRDISDYPKWDRGGISDKGLIKSNKGVPENKSAVTLFHANWDSKVAENFSKVIEDFDRNTFIFHITSDPQEIKDWKIDKLPTLRGYGPEKYMDPELFSEMSGTLNRESIREFLIAQ